MMENKLMYCLIYRFKIHKDTEELFIKSWAEVTKAFAKHCGALGSRLHKKDTSEYIAYAQWPSKEIRDNAELPSDIINGAHAEMRSCCKSVEVLFELTPVNDLLIHTSKNKLSV